MHDGQAVVILIWNSKKEFWNWSSRSWQKTPVFAPAMFEFHQAKQSDPSADMVNFDKRDLERVLTDVVYGGKCFI